MNGGDGMECLVCHNAIENEALSFWGTAICGDCEAWLMELAVDEPGYDILVRAFGLLWRKQCLAARDRHLMDGDHV